MRTIGYARIGWGRPNSEIEHKLAQQRSALVMAGCSDVRQECTHAATNSPGRPRPIIDALLNELEAGDTLMVSSLDRLCAQKTIDRLLADLQLRGVTIKALDQNLTFSPINPVTP